jgi:hypothetical protein
MFAGLRRTAEIEAALLGASGIVRGYIVRGYQRSASVGHRSIRN